MECIWFPWKLITLDLEITGFFFRMWMNWLLDDNISLKMAWFLAKVRIDSIYS